ncbi:MAG: hypothetical protein N3A54_00150 [Patescibacteria group bacterium]|nr:hypothetical protein [Patescibacteria group bacterium]
MAEIFDNNKEKIIVFPKREDDNRRSFLSFSGKVIDFRPYHLLDKYLKIFNNSVSKNWENFISAGFYGKADFTLSYFDREYFGHYIDSLAVKLFHDNLKERKDLGEFFKHIVLFHNLKVSEKDVESYVNIFYSKDEAKELHDFILNKKTLLTKYILEIVINPMSGRTLMFSGTNVDYKIFLYHIYNDEKELLKKGRI